MAITVPPLAPDQLERMRLKLHRLVPSRGLGPHLRRRAGQSLEFREYRDYQMGDDIRAVDWRASARIGGPGQWIARRFEAEERMTLALIVDARATMRLPDDAPKLLFALWTLRALAAVATASGDDVILGTLFSPMDSRPVLAGGRRAGLAAARFAEDLWATPPSDLAETPVAKPGKLIRMLRPASAVVLLSDLLFDDPAGHVAHLAREAQKSWREFFVVSLDTVEAELKLARAAERIRVATTEGRNLGTGVYEATDVFDQQVRAAVGQQIDGQFQRWAGRGLVRDKPVIWAHATGKEPLERLFRNWFPGSAVLTGIAARGGVQ